MWGWQFMVLLLVLLVIPYGMGRALTPGNKRIYTYFSGLCASWLLFEGLSVAYHVACGRLRQMSWLWVGICAFLAIYGYWKKRDLSLIHKGWFVGWSKTEILLLVFVIGLVITITGNTVFNTFYGNYDDETYCATAVTSWYTDTVNRYAPNSGEFKPPFYHIRYVLASWPVYSSTIAVLTGIHPAIVFRTILPLFVIPITCLVDYLLIAHFLPKRENALFATFLLLLLTLQTAELSDMTSREWWLVVNCWTGKSIAGNLIIPLVLWLLCRLEQEKERLQFHACQATLFFVCNASCMISSTLTYVVPFELTVFGAFYLFRTKRWKEIFFFALCVALPAVTGVVSYMVSNLPYLNQ